jgi:GYF domain 2
MSNTEYYVAVGTQKTGPFSMPDLMNQDIAKDTLIWKKGLINWTAATNLPELEDLLDNTPPPIPDQPPPIPTITRAKAEPVTLTMNVPKISPEVKQGLKTAGTFMLSLTQKVFLTILVIIVCGLISMPLPAIGRSVITFFVAIPAMGAIWTGFFSRKGKEEVEMTKEEVEVPKKRVNVFIPEQKEKLNDVIVDSQVEQIEKVIKNDDEPVIVDTLPILFNVNDGMVFFAVLALLIMLVLLC